MKLAVVANMDLASAANILTLAYEGQPRGLMQLAKALGVTGDKAKDAAFLLGEVERRGKFASDNLQTLAFQAKQASNAFQDLKEAMGAALEPAAKLYYAIKEELGKEFAIDLKQVQSLGPIAAEAFQLAYAEVEGFVKRAGATFKYYKDSLLGDSLKAQADYHNSVAKIDKDQAAKEKIASEAAQAEFDSIWAEKTAVVAAASTAQIQIQAKAHQKELQDEKDLHKKQEEELKRIAAERKKIAEDWSKAVSSNAQQAASAMTKAFMEGTLSVGKAFEILGKAIFKSIVEAIGKSLIQDSVGDFIKAAAAFAAYDYLGAEGFAASGAIKAGGGGAIIGVADAALAEGGVAVRPTRALIGEGGEPEAVVPLSKAGDFGFGGGGGSQQVTHAPVFNFPGVRNQREGAEAGRSAAREYAQHIDSLQRRKGLTLTPGVA